MIRSKGEKKENELKEAEGDGRGEELWDAREGVEIGK